MRGLRVLDLSRDLAGAYAARLLADAGACVDVVPHGEGHGWAYLDAPKHKLAEPTASGYDVVILSANGDVDRVVADAASIRSAEPATVVAVTSPFGLTGPYRNWVGGPLEHWAIGGQLALTGERDRHPLPGGGPWVTYLAGATAAIGVQAAVRNAARSGQGDLVDVGAMEALAACHQWSISLFSHNGVVKERAGNRHGEQHHPIALYPATDGWVCIASVSAHQWEGLCVAIDAVELLADETLYVPAVRFDRADELDEHIVRWTSIHTVDEIVDALQENQCPAGPVASLEDTLTHPQLDYRKYWTTPEGYDASAKMPRAPFSFQTRGDRTGPVELLGGPDDDRPLAGIRVLEFSIAWAGPLVGRNLADLGAEVIRVEHPTARGLSVGDPELGRDAAASWEWGTLPPPLVRNGVYPDADPGEDWWNRLGYFNKINRTKRSLCLDVKADGGRDVLDALVATSHIVFNNYSPRGVRSLGIDHETLRRMNPNIVTVDMSGYGATGPGERMISWGPILDASSGLASLTGYPDSGPYKQGLAFPDAVGGVLGTVAVLGALWEREATGGPVHIDLSQLETLLSVAGDQLLATSVSGQPPRRGARSAVDAPAGVYRCAGEDGWVALTVRDDEEWRALVALVDDVDISMGVSQRMAAHDAIDASISTWTSTRTKHEAMAELQAAGVPAAAVMTNQDLVEDPHLAERGFIVTLDQPAYGPRRFPGFPIHFDTATVELRPSPNLGADNDALLTDLGFDADRLRASGTVADRPPT